MSSIFLCHSSKDHAFVNWLKKELGKKYIFSWVDEGEIKVGDSLIWKIEEGIVKTKYFGAILSNNSINSNWVKKELEMAITREITSGEIFVLPILIEDVELPLFIKGKKFADFRKSDEIGLIELLEVLVGTSHLQCIVFRQERACIEKSGYRQKITIKNHSHIEYKYEKIPVLVRKKYLKKEKYFGMTIHNLTNQVKKNCKVNIKPENNDTRILNCTTNQNISLLSGGVGSNYLTYNISILHPYDEFHINWTQNNNSWPNIELIGGIWNGKYYKMDIIPGEYQRFR